MKKILLFGFITSLLILAACGQQQTPTEDQQNQMPDQQPDQQPDEDMGEDEQPENTTPGAPTQEPEENKSEDVTMIDQEVKDMISKVESDVSSYSFTYVGPPTNRPQRTYQVLGNKVRVELPQPADLSQAPPYTHVYLNTETQTATGWCEARSVTRCPNGTVRYSDVSFDEYHRKTPYQWLKDIETAEYIGSGPQWESRSTLRVEFEANDGTSGEMAIVEFYGLPGKITLDSGETIEFRDLSINSVDEEDVAQPEN